MFNHQFVRPNFPQLIEKNQRPTINFNADHSVGSHVYRLTKINRTKIPRLFRRLTVAKVRFSWLAALKTQRVISQGHTLFCSAEFVILQSCVRNIQWTKIIYYSF